MISLQPCSNEEIETPDFSCSSGRGEEIIIMNSYICVR